MNLFSRFFLILFVYAFIPVFASGVWILQWSGQIRANAQHYHEELASFASSVVEGELGRMNRAYSFLDPLGRDQGRHPGYEKKLMIDAAAAHPYLAFLAIVDRNGETLDQLSQGGRLRGSPTPFSLDAGLIARAQSTGRVALGSVVDISSIPVMAQAWPLPGGRVFYSIYSLERMYRNLRRVSIGRTGRVLLLDSAGKPLPGFDVPAGLSLDLSRLGDPSQKVGWLEDIPAAKGAMVGAWTREPSLGFWVLTLEPRAEAFARPETFEMEVFFFLIVIGLMVVGGAYAISLQLIRPIMRLGEGAERVSKGEFSQPVPELGWAELGRLGDVFNQMMGTLEGYKKLQVERILEEKARIDALLQSIPDAIFFAGFDGAVLYMNAAARDLLEFDAGQKDGSSHPRLHEAVRVPELRAMALGMMSRKKKKDSLELALTGKDGSAKGIYFCRALVVAGGGREVGFVLALRNITAERELDRMKDDFFHSIVHDLRNPLSAVEGFIGLMAKNPAFGEKEATMMGYVKQATEILRGLVSDILDLAKLESGTMDLRRDPVDGAKLIESLRSLYALQAKSGKAPVSFVLGAPPHDCLGDKDLLQRVLMNLVGNALKFTPTDGRIEVRVDGMGAQAVQFSVSDTGRGIPSDKLEFIFEKFKQLDAGKAARGGYGLGLSICKKIVDLHGGRIWAESADQKGARFIFQIPRSGPVPAVPVKRA